MSQSLSDILSLTNEAAVLIGRGRAVFANAAARRLLGEDCVGKSAVALFGTSVAGSQAASFVADVTLRGKPCIVRVNRREEGQILFFSCPDAAPAVVNDPFLCELRSGLMNISMSADLLRERIMRLQEEWLKDDSLMAAVRSLTRSYYRLLRLTTNASLVLNMADGGLPLHLSRINLSALCRSMLEMAAHFCPELNLRSELGENIAADADPRLVKQLLLNLLANCIVHAQGRSYVSVSLTDNAGSVVLSVSDDGCGITPEAMHTVFDRYRHPFAMADMTRGPGLGLTVARAITTAHKGVLLLESRPGHGTTVRASLGKSISPSVVLGATESEDDGIVRDVLTGLANCLPDDCYTEQYMD